MSHLVDREKKQILEQVFLRVLEQAGLCRTQTLKECYQYAVSTAGKMLRPQLLFTGAMLQRSINLSPELLDCAAAVEILHTASLIHDDIIDQSSTRRQKPTVVHQFGLTNAILLGDWMLARSFELVDPGGQACRQEFSLLTKTLCEGQFLEAEMRLWEQWSLEDYRNMIYMKTASMFEACLVIGANLANNLLDIDSLRRFGRHFGLSFQMLDDLKDLLESKESAGKDTGADYEAGSRTLPWILASQHKLPVMAGAPVHPELLRLSQDYIQTELDLARSEITLLSNGFLGAELGHLVTKLESRLADYTR